MLVRAACPSHLETLIAPFEYAPEQDGETAVQPDVLIGRRPIPEAGLREAPLLVVEVLSASTRRFDLTRKQAFYARCAVEHFWIVDPDVPSIEALRLVGGKYVTVTKVEAGEVFEVSEPVSVRCAPAELLDG